MTLQKEVIISYYIALICLNILSGLYDLYDLLYLPNLVGARWCQSPWPGQC